MMHHGAARIALLAYVIGGLLLPMTHQHAAPAGSAAAPGVHHEHHDGHCHAGGDCGAAEATTPLATSSMDAANESGHSHQCHGFCVLCLAAGQAVTLIRQVAWECGPQPPVVVRSPEGAPPRAVRLPRANLLRGPPALLS